MEYIISQVLGVIVCLFIIVSMLVKDIRIVMFCQIGCNGVGTISYVLLGGFAGCGIYLIATFQSILFFFIRKNGKQEPRWLQPLLIVAYVVCSAFTFKVALDLVPMVAAIFCAIGISQKKPTNYRIIMLMNSLIWCFYDIFVQAYTMLASHLITVGSALIGLIFFDIIRYFKTKKENTNDKA